MVKKFEKIHMYDFAVHECTQEQNGSPYFCPIVRQIDRHAISWPLRQELSQERLLRSGNFAIMANTTFHFSLLSTTRIKAGFQLVFTSDGVGVEVRVDCSQVPRGRESGITAPPPPK